MPRCCSVSGCKTNYKSQNENVTTFSLPRDDELKKLWLRKIPTDFTGIKNPVICIKHFAESDIIRVDRCIVKGEMKEYPRKIPKLKENAVPSTFTNLPSYLSSLPSTSKRLCDVEKENFDNALKQSLLDQKKYIEERRISSFSDVKRYFSINDTKFQNEYSVIIDDSKIALCYVNINNDAPEVERALIIKSNLEFKLYFYKKEVPLTKLPKQKHMWKINSFNVLDDLVDVVKDKHFIFIEDKSSEIQRAIGILESIENIDKEVMFAIEQLKLSQVPPNVRRYSGNTLLLSANLYICSPAAYLTIYKKKFFFLPHVRNVTKIIGTFSLHKNTMIGSIEYLKTKKAMLKEHELIVNLLLDEIYIEPVLNFKGNSVFGYSVNDKTKVAKTALVFLITGVLSKYKDVVCILPVVNLTAEQLKTMILSVVTGVEKVGFKIIALISDNNAVNRCAFELMTDSKALEPYITHPVDNNRQLFFLFDTVHIIKCIRNNWMSEKGVNRMLRFPDLHNGNILEAQLKHLEILFQQEKNSLVKYSNLLSYKVLYPSNIQKQNVKLALKIFDERNIAALKCVAVQNPSLFPNIDGTCRFLQIFINWWKIVNVKSIFEGDRFNDENRRAIKNIDAPQVVFLKQMVEWLKRWKATFPNSDTLSSQTFQAIINTNEAFLQIIPYMFEKYGVDYILLGKFQSDDLENRFGCYRQLSGANYYISYLQLLESERKLRFKSLIYLACDNKEITLKTLLPRQEPLDDLVDIKPFEQIFDHEFFFNDIASSVLPILTYITGYVVMKELRTQNCSICSQWLQTDKNVEVSIPCDLTLELDRGKLTLPTIYATTAVAICWFTLQKLIDLYLDTFMSQIHQLSVLQKLSAIKLKKYYDSMNDDLSGICLCQKTLNTLLECVGERSCKILLNNFVKNQNDSFNSQKPARKKLKKLTGK